MPPRSCSAPTVASEVCGFSTAPCLSHPAKVAENAFWATSLSFFVLYLSPLWRKTNSFLQHGTARVLREWLV